MDDLDRFWDDIFSADAGRVAQATSRLDAAEREAVIAHLQAIVDDPDRPSDQRRAAQVALSVLKSPHLVLASSSPRRRELIGWLGLPFTTTSADIEEVALPNEAPAAMVARLSREKAEAARATIPLANQPTILVSADTTVSLDGEVLGKPRDAAEARSMLTRLRGRSHQVFTAVTIIDLITDQLITDLASTDVPLRDFSNADMDAYVATGDPFDKAGSYAIQHNGFNPVATLTGCYANVVGLPLCHVTRSLRALGIDPPVDVPAACQAHLKYECPVYQSVLAGRDE